MKKNKEKKPETIREIDYEKISKEVKQSFYDLNKTYIDLVSYINESETKKKLLSIKETHIQDFIKKGAEQVMVDYLYDSINNKIKQLQRKDELNLGKLRTISNNKF